MGASTRLDDIDWRWGGRGALGFDRRPRPDERQRRGRLGVTLTCGPHWQRVREGRRGGGVLGRVGRKDWAGGKIRRGEEEVGRGGWGRVRSLFCFSFFFKSFSNQIFKPFLKSIFHTNFSKNF
jgi:hypothetical protein